MAAAGASAGVAAAAVADSEPVLRELSAKHWSVVKLVSPLLLLWLLKPASSYLSSAHLQFLTIVSKERSL